MNEACHSLISGIPCIGAGPVKAERCDRREQASRREALTGGADATQRLMREWQARRGGVISSHRWLGHGSVRRPVRPASIRTFVEPTGSCLLAFSIAFGCCHLKRDLRSPLPVSFVQPLGAVTRTRRYVHPRCPNGFPGPSQLADPHCSLVLHSPASGRRFRRLLAPAAPASGARLRKPRRSPTGGAAAPPVSAPPPRALSSSLLTAREISLCPKRRRSLSDPLRPRITCAPCTSSFRRYTSPLC